LSSQFKVGDLVVIVHTEPDALEDLGKIFRIDKMNAKGVYADSFAEDSKDLVDVFYYFHEVELVFTI
jgi:hypothetical protein